MALTWGERGLFPLHNMKHILVLGAGRSSYSLIQYLLRTAPSQNWTITVGDANPEAAREKILTPAGVPHPLASATAFDGNDAEACDSLMIGADLVISLLPPHLHINIAKACVKFGRPLITASYVSPAMQALDADARGRGVLLLNECGLDPGLDHASAMQVIHRLQRSDAQLTAFRSYTGGLVAPESDNNPWHYKFTWNPRNVVLAGQGTAKYIVNGQYKYVPYHRLFTHTEPIWVEGYGEFEGYPNRDSLAYRETYGLQNIPTMLRGTLRRKGFCAAWNTFVQLGLTDDSYVMENLAKLSKREFVNSFLQYSRVYLVEEKIARVMNEAPDSELLQKIRWLGLLGHERLGVARATPAQVLQKILEEKWRLEPEDKDMIVMQHQFEYVTEEDKYALTSSLVVLGESQLDTAMAKTVGLPLGIAAKMVLGGNIQLSGVQLPIRPEIYGPMLAELVGLGIRFVEEESKIMG
jgi:saccharopine dehydrogenase-like NADP-dependent oxidoreductase